MLSCLHMVSSLNLGGAERLVIDLCSLANTTQHKVAILNLGSSEDTLSEEAERLGIEVYHTPLAMGRLKRYLTILKVINERSPKALHLHSHHALRFILPILPLIAMKTRVVFTRHGVPSLSELRWKFMFQLSRPFVRWVTFVTKPLEDEFISLHKWNPHKLITIDNGILVPELEADSDKPKGKLKLGSVGRLEAVKGHHFLFRALSQLSAQHKQAIELHIFGTGSLEQELKDYCQQHLADMSVVFHGMVYDRDAIYSNLDIMVVSSEYEGLSLGIMEAMARKIPAIATNVGGNPVLVKHEETGLLVEYNDEAGLANGVVRLLEDRDLLKNLGEAARSLIKQQYSIDEMLAQYIKLYEG